MSPQALGITPGTPSAGGAAGGPGEGSATRPDSSTPSSTPPSPAISTKTMEQLAEFDSILGNKISYPYMYIKLSVNYRDISA